METIPSIAVVVSTYNGARYIAEQLDSVLAQDYPNVHIVVRDDGSSDGTLSILRSYAARGDIELVEGENVGVVSSFLGLVSHVAEAYDYVALCDQDDVWHPDKLSRAVSLLAQRDQTLPQLYCSEHTLCDASMRPVGKSHLNRIGVSFRTQLYENIVFGNTCVFNRRLAERVAEVGIDGVYSHDWWISLVACALGELTFDNFSSLDYRRTGANVSPSGMGGFAFLLRRIKIFFVNEGLASTTTQLRRLYELYADEMDPQKRAFIELFLQGGRLRKVFVPARLRQKISDEIALRLLFLFGLL